jgi:hypothetical protein
MSERYMILIREPENHQSLAADARAAEQARIHAAHTAFFEAISAAGATFEDGAGLTPANTAVRIIPARDGKPAVFTDGPFGETKEVISGYYTVSVPDAATARELAAKCPTGGWVELWPIMDTSSGA